MLLLLIRVHYEVVVFASQQNAGMQRLDKNIPPLLLLLWEINLY